ncbi:protein kinase STUNTED-like isoform X2 [Primulina eburnea]|uniref:protein kinase STUNTED-like isoform X2 n=1 Tax=Primulina eburnea TaxID=1245227 RepID=UPI003C6C9D11
MMWDFGLACVIPRRRRRSSSKNSEHNKAWLLAGPGGCDAEEPHSVHSSFRFSLCSQIELESMPVNSSCSATVLMVNLDNGMLADSKTRELKWRRIESLERSISHVSHSLIRFSYSDILRASRNFSKEKNTEGKGCPALQWSVRYKIAVGIAEAIEYLHNGTERCVVHRDIKPSNIVLSSKVKPKLCDFGLATWTPARSVPFLCKTVKGTFGYLAPEYFQHGKVSDKTDVYAFGVVLLELITGRKPIESRRGRGEENLVSWAKPLLQLGAVEKLLDPRLNFTTEQSNQIAQIIEAASACITYEESLRPDMREIIKLLTGKKSVGLSRKKAVLTSYNSTATDFNSQIQGMKNEMSNHFSLAMLGAEFDDDYHFHCR